MAAIPPDTPLNSRPRAVIVGASRGIGAHLARKLVERGYYLALLSRSKDALDSLTSELNADSQENARFYPHDVTDYESVPGLFQNILSDLKRIDSVVYNAGVMPSFKFSEYDFSKNKSMIDVQLLGAMAWLAPAAVLFEKMRSGQIVGISSVAAERGRVVNPGYNASKAGFDTFLEGLRNRLSRSGVHVLTIRPGPTETHLTREVGGFMMTSPQVVAGDIAKAMQGSSQIVYTPRRWRWVMLIVRNIPSVIFRRLNF